MAVQPMTKFRQFCDAKDATFQGKKHGDVFHWDVYQDVSNAAASSLTETNTMPETNFTIVQGTLTIQEAGKLIARFLSGLIAVVMGFNMAVVA